jgi:diadenosine tetraphosphate (Ap4A) HIT family hydrolase
MGVEGCLACDLADGRLPLRGGRIHETEHWLVEHCVGPLGVGALIVKPKRHVVHVWELADEEAQELGPLLRDAASVVSELSRPEQVYMCLWSHGPGHIHYVVQPVTRSQTDALGAGPHLQVALFEAGELPPADEVEAFAERARAAFAAREVAA